MKAAYLVARPEQDVAADEKQLRSAGYDVRVVIEPPPDPAADGSLVIYVPGEPTSSSGPRSPLAGLRGQQRELIQALFDRVPSMFCVFNADGSLAWMNHEFERVLGYTAADLQGRNATEVFYPEESERQRAAQYIQKSAGEWGEFVTTCRSGEKLHTSWTNLRLSDGTIIGIGKDITVRKQAEELRTRFIEQAIQAQEEERQRLALELHDEMGQSLATLLLGLKALEEDLEDGEAREQVRLLREITAQSVAEVGRLARGLRPGALDDLGFPAAIEAHVSELKRAQLLQVDLHMNGFDGRQRMPKPVENHLYRMVQEALTNVVKHARASSASVVLRRETDSVLAIVEDDGTGFQTKQEGPHDDVKLASIRERALLVGGSVSIESVNGHGTTLYIRVPLPSGEA